jgi:hypothetical protein
LDFTVGASGRANEAARPISVKDVDANLGDRATHDIVHARPAEGIGPFEAGNATGVMAGLNRRGRHLLSLAQRWDHDCDTEQCYPSQSSFHLEASFFISIEETTPGPIAHLGMCRQAAMHGIICSKRLLQTGLFQQFSHV